MLAAALVTLATVSDLKASDIENSGGIPVKQPADVPTVEKALRLLRREDRGAEGVFVHDGSDAAPANTTAPTCELSKSQGCDLSNMPKDTSYLVRPGGKTRCLFSTTTPYQFEVLRGDADKVLLFFQGGGACWDSISTDVRSCNTGAFPQGAHGGVFDRQDERNPFRTYTLVHVLYCDGTVHGGNVTRAYHDPAGRPVEQRGYENARSVVDWVKAQMSTGQLASPLASLVISGCSAGSIGSQLWADAVLTELPYTAAAVVPDSYAGVFPTSAEGRLVHDLGFCGSSLLAPLGPDLLARCKAKKLALHTITAAAIARHPNVAFAQVQSKADEVQMAFDAAISADPIVEPFGCHDFATCYTGPDRFYADTNDIFKVYDALPNHVHFYVQAVHHCYLPHSQLYSADPSGAHGGGKGGEALTHWLGRLPLRDGSGESVPTRCDGAERHPPWVGDRYCDARMANKVFHAPTARNATGTGGA